MVLCASCTPATSPRVRRHASIVLLRHSLIETSDGAVAPLSVWKNHRQDDADGRRAYSHPNGERKEWFNVLDFKVWLHQVQGYKYSAFWSLYNKFFSIILLWAGLLLLAICEEQNTQLDARTLPPFSSISAPTTSAVTSVGCKLQHSVETTLKPASLQMFLLDVTRAKVLWLLQPVMTHKYMQSTAADVEIAGRTKFQKDKIVYSIVFGLALYFRQELLQLCISDSKWILIFISGTVVKKVPLWFLTSAFLDQSRAVDLLMEFQQAMMRMMQYNLILEHVVSILCTVSLKLELMAQDGM
ncbi:hypothetical protein PR048_014026 [Dryococelus australis]|uniref:Uncharacterized protein n=1 Tax=Dryococelus australis TaxID=614101 RepID=A0ABQ9HTV7_9NEOP|nr:hypothetical protein PR048_014026 [Dryococelus australis]